jgi:hypothetical protein
VVLGLHLPPLLFSIHHQTSQHLPWEQLAHQVCSVNNYLRLKRTILSLEVVLNP